jgi:EAL domain-containing protein (putative c-di-GMP-specific phosphodiesterase class I)
MNKSVEDRLTIEQYLRPALKKSEFRLEYQPQVSVDGTTIRGFEALIRWDNPILGLISPMEFIRAAEENRSIIPIGQWVMRTACTKIKGLNLEYGTSWVMAVNVSPVELKEPNFAASVHHIIQETDIRPEWLEIEITENIAVDEFSQLRETLEELHRLGVKLSIDDFGTGYSSLSYIQNIPLDVLKVDRTFITHLGEPTGQNLMTETIFLMTKKLGLLTIAEGVETPSQLAWLKTMGCDYVQGYLISRPLPCEPLRQFIREKLGR